MLSVFVSVFPANLSRRVIVRGSRLCFVLFPELNGHLASGVVFGDVKERVAAADRCDGSNMHQCNLSVNALVHMILRFFIKINLYLRWVNFFRTLSYSLQ